ncbi:hypothetical protein L1987_47973 [Smallanthus sonchifolius]|uniref:Uncharacterized protein n=1 Tax=Smallanthus sonchifolius TaxID=185202 RepID=A0ACB9FQB9_9ASTR|nr:hypothetical protein L1987_47973 [Smallanthus sonchifolius]
MTDYDGWTVKTDDRRSRFPANFVFRDVFRRHRRAPLYRIRVVVLRFRSTTFGGYDIPSPGQTSFKPGQQWSKQVNASQWVRVR